MAKLHISAKILTSAEKPVKNLRVSIQAFSMRTSRWNTLINGVTNTTGVVTLERSQNPDIGSTFAPALRLVERGARGLRVLATIGKLSFQPEQKLLKVEFGNIERPDSVTRGGQAAIAASRIPRSSRTLGQPVRAASVEAATESASVNPETARTALLLNQEIQTLKVRETTLNSQIIDLDRKALLQKSELTTANKQILDLRKSLETSETSKMAAENTVQNLSASLSKTTRIDTIFSSVGQKLDSANKKMKNDAIPFQVSSIKLDLRGTLINHGESIVLDGIPGKDGTSGGGDGRLQAEILPADSTDDETLIKVPNITGLTEQACRRVLVSIGLKLKKATQSLKAGKGTPGQAIQQLPKANTNANRGDEILVVFGIAPIDTD